MKSALHTICTLLTLIIILAHGAADNQNIPLSSAIVGFSCGTRGNNLLITPAELSAASNKYGLTLVYSEHPTLKTQEALNDIAQSLMATKWKSCDYALFKKRCEEKIAQYIVPAIKTKEDNSIIPINHQESCNLIALQIILSIRNIQFIGYHQNKGSGSGSYSLWQKNPRITHIRTNCHLPFSKTRLIESAQQEAERLQTKQPNKPYHLVIDLNAWRNIVRKPYKEQKAARKQRPLSPAALEKLQQCPLQ